jgi:hypothetical protein
MIVYLKPVTGTAKDNLERAKVEMERVIGFRGTVTGAKAEGNRIEVTIEVNPKWDLPEAQKDLVLREWIKAKTKTVFTVLSIK